MVVESSPLSTTFKLSQKAQETFHKSEWKECNRWKIQKRTMNCCLQGMTATAKSGLSHLHQACVTLGLSITSGGLRPQSSPMSYWLLNNPHEGTVILLSYGPNCETTMLNGLLYTCVHTWSRLNSSELEPKQKGINVGKGWLGVPRRDSNKESGEVRKNVLHTSMTPD